MSRAGRRRKDDWVMSGPWDTRERIFTPIGFWVNWGSKGSTHNLGWSVIESDSEGVALPRLFESVLEVVQEVVPFVLCGNNFRMNLFTLSTDLSACEYSETHSHDDNNNEGRGGCAGDGK